MTLKNFIENKNMFIIVNRFLVPNGFRGITIFPFIFLKDKSCKTETTIKHEKIHIRQQLELLIILFYLLYLLEFLVCLYVYKKKSLAYRMICFEREAYNNQHSPKYFKFFGWIKYL